MAVKAVAKRRQRWYTRRNRSRPKKMTLPLAVIAGLAGPVATTIRHTQDYGVTGPDGGLSELSRILTGYDPYSPSGGWQSWRLRYGLYPILLGLAVHKLAGWVGVNRALAATGIPLIRI